jgi:hypothetical protein
MPNVTPITPPRVPLIDPRTGYIDRAWYLFFLSLNNAAIASSDNVDYGPSPESLISSYDAALQELTQNVDTQQSSVALLPQIAELQKQIDGLQVQPPPTQGTITSVTATAPVVSSGGITPNISMASASTSTDGYLTSTDWNTFNNKGSGTVTSVTGTAPVVSSGGSTPAISMAAATTSVNGYLTSTDWNTFNNKQPIAAPATYTANFSVATTDVWIINNKSGSSCTATLPAASGYLGRVLHFQNYQAQTLVSASSNVVAIGGGAAGTSILLASAGDQSTLVSDGTNWIMMQYVPNNILLLE